MFTDMENKLWTGLLKLLLLLLAVSYFLISPPPFTAKFERQPMTSSIPVKFEFTLCHETSEYFRAKKDL